LLRYVVKPLDNRHAPRQYVGWVETVDEQVGWLQQRNGGREMTTKRVLVALVGALAVMVLAVAPAGSQVPDPDPVSPPIVLPIADEPREVAQPDVLPRVVGRPLPVTGGEFGPEVLAGIVLTGAGLALAAGARRRRRRLAVNN
jgi:hypothetical protein